MYCLCLFFIRVFENDAIVTIEFDTYNDYRNFILSDWLTN